MPRGWYRRIGRTPLFTSTIIAGASPLGSMPQLYGYDVSESEGVDFVLSLLRSPIRAIDTSNNYGDGTSERRIGKAIASAGGVPDDFLVITKVDRAGDDFSGDRVRASFRESLERLGVQRVPLLFLHDPDAFDFEYMASAGGAVDALVQIRDEGLVDAIGVATGDTRLLHRYLDLGVFDAILCHNRFTLVDRSADELFTRAVDLGVGVLNAAVYGQSRTPRDDRRDGRGLHDVRARLGHRGTPVLTPRSPDRRDSRGNHEREQDSESHRIGGAAHPRRRVGRAGTSRPARFDLAGFSREYLTP
jgi:D-threo-aldose 1-dehydrogenase